MKAAKLILVQNKIRPSYHRVRILYYLLHNNNHPTAEKIYRELLEETQTISKVTVYNTLNLFVEKGLIRALDIAGEETCYDARTSFHAHFQCLHCGQISDFSGIDCSEELRKLPHTIVDAQFLLKGFCANCLHSRESEEIKHQFLDRSLKEDFNELDKEAYIGAKEER